METAELVECLRKKVVALTAELRAVFVVGQALRPAERLEKADGLIATAKQFLGLVRDITALELALERAEAAYGRFKAARVGLTERQQGA